MKLKGFKLGLITAGLFSILFCLTASQVMAGGTNPPGLELDEKAVGPSIKGFLFVGWVDKDSTMDGGTVEAYLWVEGKLYAAFLKAEVWNSAYPEYEFTNADNMKAFILTWILPQQIAIDYKLPGADPRILTDKDISNFVLINGLKPPLDDPEAGEVEGYFPGGFSLYPLTYKHVFHCEVKISLVVLR